MTEPRRWAARLALILMGAGFVAQSLFLFWADSIPLTITSVIVLSLSATMHAATIGGWRLAVAVVGGVGVLTLIAEAIGIATGIPFGEYAYTGALGPELLGVSLLIPLAWLTLAYPAFIIARFLIGVGSVWKLIARVLVSAVALTAWDVFLDPQMVDAGNWGWANPEPSLPGTPGIPLTNYAGWLLTATIIALVLEAAVAGTSRVRPRDAATGTTALPHAAASRPTAAPLHPAFTRSTILRPFAVRESALSDAQPYLVYLWTWLTSIAGNLTFWSRPSVALAGGIAMGVIAIPLIVSLCRVGRRGYVFQMLTWSTERDIRTKLDAVAVDGPLPRHAVLAPNHSSWWDGSLLAWIAHRFALPFTVMIGSARLNELSFLRHAGAVDERELRTIARRLGQEPEGWGVIFPEGALQPPHTRAALHRGAAWAAVHSGAPLVPLAIRVTLRGGILPEAYLRFGEPIPSTGRTVAELATELERALLTLVTSLDRDISATDPEGVVPGFRRIPTGRDAARHRGATLADRWLSRLAGTNRGR